ncbi:MAG: translation initiation factor IF-2 [SAR202 cluster bacterium]|nr:translation initiation factor IF-2 [SAR202 cluster bacterium]
MTSDSQNTTTRRVKKIDIPPVISVSDLADNMEVNPVEVVKGLMRGGYMFAVNDVIDRDIASVVVQLFGFQANEIEDESSGPASLTVDKDSENPDLLETRPPVVTILGHVDHGKTTLLDSIRKTNVVDGEAGGITQHIAAYQIESEGGLITFLDTPGHEAFTAMRARGAQVTDLAILVVAADDGVMPQTIEAIDHARAANVPIIIAVTKTDLPSANIDNVYRQLSEHELLVEPWGGDIIAVPLSGLSGEGVPELIENIHLVAEISEFKANPERDARGVVVEARLERNRGTLATVLVQTGTLHQGEIVVMGEVYGKIRAIFDDKGNRIKEAGPSAPVEIMGLSEVPEAGTILNVAETEKEARRIVDERQVKSNREAIRLQDVHSRGTTGNIRQVDLIIKTDVQGSIEAVRNALDGLNGSDTRVNLVHIASGNITERDVLLAVASEAIIIGFNTVPEGGAQSLANKEGVEVRQYDVIYHLVEDIDKALVGLLEPEYDDVYFGRASVRAVFSLGRRARVAGIYVNDGRITRECTVHVLRNGEEIHVGSITTLKHFKDDVREVATGFEGGLTVDGFNDFKEDDVIEAYSVEQI